MVALGTSSAAGAVSSSSSLGKTAALAGDFESIYTLDAALKTPTAILVPPSLSTHLRHTHGMNRAHTEPRVILGRPYDQPVLAAIESSDIAYNSERDRNTIAVSIPASTQTGDLLIATMEGFYASWDIYLNAPAGWTQKSSINPRFWATTTWTKIATESDIGSVHTFNSGGTTASHTDLTIVVLRIPAPAELLGFTNQQQAQGGATSSKNATVALGGATQLLAITTAYSSNVIYTNTPWLPVEFTQIAYFIGESGHQGQMKIGRLISPVDGASYTYTYTGASLSNEDTHRQYLYALGFS